MKVVYILSEVKNRRGKMYHQSQKDSLFSLLLFCFIYFKSWHEMYTLLQREFSKLRLIKSVMKPTNIFAGVDSHCSRLVSQCHINNDRRILYRPEGPRLLCKDGFQTVYCGRYRLVYTTISRLDFHHSELLYISAFVLLLLKSQY